jgi:hypothetical protein
MILDRHGVAVAFDGQFHFPPSFLLAPPRRSARLVPSPAPGKATMNRKEARELREQLKAIEQLPPNDESPQPAEPRDEPGKRCGFLGHFLSLLPWTVLGCVLFFGTRAYGYLPALSSSMSWENVLKPMVVELFRGIGSGLVAALAGAVFRAGRSNLRFLDLLPWAVLGCVLFFGARAYWYLSHQGISLSWENSLKPMAIELLKGIGCGLVAALAGVLVHAGRSNSED